MRSVFLLLLVIIGSGCATPPHEGSDVGRWRVVPLNPGMPSGESRAVLLDSQTGDTWISGFQSNAWMKLSK